MVEPASPSPRGLPLHGRLRFLARDAAFYGLAASISKLFALLLFPVLARYFSLEEYGAYDYLAFALTLGATLVVFGQDSSIGRHFFEFESLEERRQVVSQSVLLQLACAALGVAALLSLGSTVGLPVAVEGGGWLVLVLALHLPILVLANVTQNLLKWTFSRRAFAIVTLGQVATQTTLILAAIAWTDLGVPGVFAIALASRALFALIGVYFCRSWFSWPRVPLHLRALVRFAAPYGVIGAVSAFMPVMERTLVATGVGEAALGAYAAGAAIAALVTLPLTAFQTAWEPFSLSLHKEGDAVESYNRALRAFTAVMGSGVVALAAAAPLLVRILAGPGYNAAWIVIFPIALAYSVQGISWITEVGIGFSKRTHLQLSAYGAFVGTSLVVAIALLPVLGILAVALALLAGHLAKAIVASVLAQRAHPLAWEYRRVIGAVILTITAGVVIGLAHHVSIVWGTAVGIVAWVTLAWAFWRWLADDAIRDGVKRAIQRAPPAR